MEPAHGLEVTSAGPIAAAVGDPARYLAFEMQRVERRVEAWLAARDGRVDYLVPARALAEERLLLRAARADAAADGVALPFEALVRRCGLGPADEDLLMLALAPHLSQRVTSLLLHAQGTVLKPHVELGLALELVAPAADRLSARQLLAPEAPLVAHRLVRVEPPSDGGALAGFLQWTLRGGDHVAAFVCGRDALDQRLAGFCRRVAPARRLHDLVLAGRLTGVVHALLAAATQAPERPWVALTTGPRQAGRSALCGALAAALARPLLRIDLERLPRDGEAALLVRHAADVAAFDRAVLLFDKPEVTLARRAELRGAVEAVLREHPGLVVLECDQPGELPPGWVSAVHVVLDLERPGVDERAAIWRTLLGEVATAPDVAPGELAMAHDLVGGQIAHAIDWARHLAGSQRSAVVRQVDLTSGARTQLRGRLGDLTDATRARLGLDDLVLAPEPMAQVRELLGACRARMRVMDRWGFARRLATGKGLVALFAGEAGTGKALTAEILATELGARACTPGGHPQDRQQVGRRDGAEHPIGVPRARAPRGVALRRGRLALHEAGGGRALAGPLPEWQVNALLLQEVERFEGIWLTTASRPATDKAFQRAALFRIDFPAPGPVERARIWRTLLPREADVAGPIDFDALGDALDLSGGQIKNAVLRAAYRACSEGAALSQAHLLESGTREAPPERRQARARGAPSRAPTFMAASVVLA
ncbi:MAG: hypothetical protein U1F43_29225 [Myxococcota bacterium]